MIEVNVRDIVGQDFRQRILRQKHSVWYEDGKAVSRSWRVLLADSILLEMSLLAPELPISSKWSLVNFMRDGEFARDSMTEMVRFMCFELIDAGVDRRDVQREAFRVFYGMLHEISEVASEDVCGVTSHDILAIIEDPVMTKIQANVRPNPYSIDASYKAMYDRLKQLTKTHAIAAAAVSGTASQAQVAQCIGPIGFVADTRGSVVAKPILSGFNGGLNEPWELVAESLKARVSAIATDIGIADADYIQRRLQLLVMVVRGYEDTDCGNDRYFDVPVDSERALKNLKGMTVIDPDTQSVVVCAGNETRWVGNSVKMRDFLSCRLHDPQYVCTHCYGESLKSLPKSDNVGYSYAYSNLQAAIQDVLSTKHILNSVKMTSYRPDEDVGKYLEVDPETDMLYLRDEVDMGDEFSLLLPVAELVKLADSLSANAERNGTSLAKVGNLSTLGILRKEKFDGATRITSAPDWYVEILDLAPGRQVFITREFLTFIRQARITSDTKGNFIIPMTGWDKNSPLLYSPHIQPKAAEWLNAFMRIVESNNDKATPHQKVVELFTKALERLDIGMTTILIIVYSMCRQLDERGNEAGMARHVPIERMRFLSATTLYHNSASLGQLLPYQEQGNVLFSKTLAPFDPRRTPHPFDVLLAPHVYMKHERK